MGRVGRVLSESGYYHVIQRGNNRKWLFRDDEDFAALLGLMKQWCAEHDVVVNHYCLMTNHIHFLMYAKSVKNISKLMHVVQRCYHHYYRKKHKWSGHLFQGRFKSLAIHSDEYLLECGRYIERNPVRAKMVGDAGDWDWSSYGVYAKGREDSLTQHSVGYMGLASTEDVRQEMWRKYVAEERAYEKLVERELLKA